MYLVYETQAWTNERRWSTVNFWIEKEVDCCLPRPSGMERGTCIHEKTCGLRVDVEVVVAYPDLCIILWESCNGGHALAAPVHKDKDT